MEELNVLPQKERGKSRWDGACLGTNPYRQVNGAVQHQSICHSRPVECQVRKSSGQKQTSRSHQQGA